MTVLGTRVTVAVMCHPNEKRGTAVERGDYRTTRTLVETIGVVPFLRTAAVSFNAQCILAKPLTLEICLRGCVRDDRSENEIGEIERKREREQEGQ